MQCIVDLGSGKGYLAEELARRGLKVVGIDSDPVNALGAERRHRLLVSKKHRNLGKSKATAKGADSGEAGMCTKPIQNRISDTGG